jgi:hypothetical protein
MDRPIYNRRVQVDDFAQRKGQRKKKKRCMAHTIDNKEMYLQFGKDFAEGGCRVERSLALRSTQCNSSQGLGHKIRSGKQQKQQVNKPVQLGRHGRPRHKTIVDFLGVGQKKRLKEKAPPQDQNGR